MSGIDRAKILTMIPHAGAMCLLDTVLDWDEVQLRGLSRRYRDADNPLRRPDGVLGAATGVEIAAQAMAVHGRLTSTSGAAPARGLLVSLRDVQLRGHRLDAVDADLVIEVNRLTGDENGASYGFLLTVQDREVLSGRAMVLLPGAA